MSSITTAPTPSVQYIFPNVVDGGFENVASTTLLTHLYKDGDYAMTYSSGATLFTVSQLSSGVWVDMTGDLPNIFVFNDKWGGQTYRIDKSNVPNIGLSFRPCDYLNGYLLDKILAPNFFVYSNVNVNAPFLDSIDFQREIVQAATNGDFVTIIPDTGATEITVINSNGLTSSVDQGTRQITVTDLYTDGIGLDSVPESSFILTYQYFTSGTRVLVIRLFVRANPQSSPIVYPLSATYVGTTDIASTTPNPYQLNTGHGTWTVDVDTTPSSFTDGVYAILESGLYHVTAILNYTLSTAEPLTTNMTTASDAPYFELVNAQGGTVIQHTLLPVVSSQTGTNDLTIVPLFQGQIVIDRLLNLVGDAGGNQDALYLQYSGGNTNYDVVLGTSGTQNSTLVINRLSSGDILA